MSVLESFPGLDIESRAKFGYTPMHLAARRNAVPAIAWLACRGADKNAGDRDGNSSLQMAADKGHFDCLFWLLAHGAKPDAPDMWDDTPLHDAASNGHIECVVALLKYGANHTLRNCNGDTPGDLARLSNLHPLADFIDAAPLERVIPAVAAMPKPVRMASLLPKSDERQSRRIDHDTTDRALQQAADLLEVSVKRSTEQVVSMEYVDLPPLQDLESAPSPSSDDTYENCPIKSSVPSTATVSAVSPKESTGAPPGSAASVDLAVQTAATLPQPQSSNRASGIRSEPIGGPSSDDVPQASALRHEYGSNAAAKVGGAAEAPLPPTPRETSSGVRSTPVVKSDDDHDDPAPPPPVQRRQASLLHPPSSSPSPVSEQMPRSESEIDEEVNLQLPEAVREWLQEMRLSDYANSFARSGYDDLEVIATITEDDLDMLGVHALGHRKRLLLGARRLKDRLERDRELEVDDEAVGSLVESDRSEIKRENLTRQLVSNPALNPSTSTRRSHMVRALSPVSAFSRPLLLSISLSLPVFASFYLSPSLCYYQSLSILC
jgi:hypothetical protein